MERNQITFFRSYFTAIRRIKKKTDRCDAYDALFDYAFSDILPDLEALPDAAAIAFDLVKPNLDSSKRKAEFGSKGGKAKQTPSKTEANAKQSASKTEANAKQTGSDKEKDKEKDKEREKEIYKEIISYLNEKTGKSFRANADKTVSHIHARLAEGYTVDQFRTVIDNKCADWLHDKKMQEYLRPETLFGSKFESYLNAGGNHGEDSASQFGNVI